MSNEIEVIKTEADSVIVRISLTAVPRLIERELSRRLKPYRLPKTPEVRWGIEYMARNPGMSASEASHAACGSDKLARRIAYWSAKVITGGQQ